MKKVLISDDDYAMIGLLTSLCSKVLSQSKIIVVQKKDQALEAIHQENFDLAIVQFGEVSHLTNKNSIRIDAFDIVRAVKKHNPETKIIVTSSYSFTRNDFLNLGVNCFINSPFNRDQLTEAIFQLT